MRRIAELIDWNNRQQPIAAIDEVAHVARECAGAARYRDNGGDPTGGDLARLRLGALPGWIEYDGIELIELRCGYWRLEQIAALGMERFEACGACGSALERKNRWFVRIAGKHARMGGEPQCKGADAGKQVGDVVRREGGIVNELRQHGLGPCGRLQKSSGW